MVGAVTTISVLGGGDVGGPIPTKMVVESSNIELALVETPSHVSSWPAAIWPWAETADLHLRYLAIEEGLDLAQILDAAAPSRRPGQPR